MPKLLFIVALVASTQASAGAFTPYSCTEIQPAEQRAEIDPALVSPWRALADREVDVPWLWLARRQAARELPELDLAARVRLQHEVLVVASRLDRDVPLAKTPYWRKTRVQLVALVKRLAPSASELATLGASSQPRVTAVLGDDYIQRATSNCDIGKLIHVGYNGGLLAFRPLRTQTKRALVSQLVALDQNGNPHITPLVDTIEMRLGNAVTSPACVVQAAADGTLHTTTPTTMREHAPFVARQGEGVGCNNCHHAENTMHARDIADRELARIDAVRDAQVDDLLGSMWQRLQSR